MFYMTEKKRPRQRTGKSLVATGTPSLIPKITTPHTRGAKRIKRRQTF